MTFELSDPVLQKIAREQLNERPQTAETDLQNFKDWILKQPHLTPNINDKFLISFLRNAKYRLEKAKEKYDFYYTFRTMCPEYYLERIPIQQNLVELIKSGVFVDLPDLHPIDHGIITVTSLGKLHELNCSVNDFMRMLAMYNDRYMLYNVNAIVAGEHSIIDFRGSTMITASQTAAIAKKFVLAVQNVYPIRMCKFHLVNLKEAPPLFEPVIKLVKNFLKKKMAQKIVIHDNLETLYKEIPKSILPNSLGGDGGSLESILEKHCQDVYFKDNEWFNEDAVYTSDESKRIGGPAFHEMFGTDGSFRKLEID